MKVFKPLESYWDWRKVWKAQKSKTAGPMLLFKVSPDCPNSRAAGDRIYRALESLDEETLARVEIYSVHVIEQRRLSQRIEKITGVMHQSPQALVFGPKRTLVWHASHLNITEKDVVRALKSV